ncbi:MAG: hypothetical protein R2792_14650 [Saprospiraceae bacterium]
MTPSDTPDLTHLPFGGIAPASQLLIPKPGPTWPTCFPSGCGLPSGQAGNSDASDWTNPDGSWDYNHQTSGPGQCKLDE